ncbi:MAG: hypothetical protein LBC94_10020 [Desulfovibrio sp.]|jgi:hypothetical protein|nr:hypothetical protein [Desulfovibrio sp.]
MAAKKPLLIIALLLALAGGFYLYINIIFPPVRCEAAKHPEAPEQYADCLECHLKVTPATAQNWRESKHGVLLVKCVVCHGLPDGKGSVPFAAKPGVQDICVRCHEPAMKQMVEKYGAELECDSCHPHHQNPMHRRAFEAKKPSKTSF